MPAETGCGGSVLLTPLTGKEPAGGGQGWCGGGPLGG